MAVNESIVTGRYFRRYTDAVNKVWQRISFWHKASDCEFDDGQTAQTKVGAIKGITTSTSVTETGYAADMTTVKNLQTQINELNSNLMKIKKQTYTPAVTDTIQKVTLESTPKNFIAIHTNNPDQGWYCGFIVFYDDSVIKKGSPYGNTSYYPDTMNFDATTNELSFMFSDTLGKTIDIYYC